jgi:outer membrane protein assembly factor BamE (lipoprotein component of BamABCDE complex)
MKFNFKTQIQRALLTMGFLLSSAVTHAAGGFTVNPEQEEQVKVGMTMTEVLQALGRPSRNIKYGNEPGPTWVYNVNGNTISPAVFEVDFGADGKVASVHQRMPSELDGGFESN